MQPPNPHLPHIRWHLTSIKKRDYDSVSNRTKHILQSRHDGRSSNDVSFCTP
ncbi:hypothetical protein BKA82DRAFT_1002570 [Pisolithus tinctorius]|uniref:Uncharacterized protein n=1 Tax=Pisolithus tinctorius Marx 270 TaxID=870435 RepID=A0A0C3IZC1_PISTI|nr:hypothetical protein BKA82DRAFT_1002570 [Pisolithus tinctorius]KIO02148.1 hypothetical protein M404DRAFT_1002570 [Pisolithus tinctorius Marx 270]